MNGIRIRFETKPGKSFASRGRLAEILGERDDRRGRLVRGLHGADHLDELQHRHRVEEVHADHPVGPAVAAASDVIGIDDVFEARIASGGSDVVGAPEDLLLHLGVLDDRLDHEIGGRRDRRPA